MNSHFTYCLLLAGSLVFPLALSFDKKVAFVTKWKYFFQAVVIPAVFYIIWDIIFTAKGIWWFNQQFITGISLVGLPIEEILFFVVVPFCCVFIYECVRTYFPNLRTTKTSNNILFILAIFLFALAAIFYERAYTFVTSILTASFIIGLRYSRFYKTFNATAFLISYVLILIPFLVVNGVLTSLPVVIYSDAENTGVRISTIPAEDIFYGMLLIMWTVVLYERHRQKVKKS